MPLVEDIRNQILSMLQKGVSDQDIARQLSISANTVRAVRAHITMGTYKQSSVANEELIEAEEIRFGLEKDLQWALRNNIQQLEAGLKVSDKGTERQTSAGFIDITCEDGAGNTVVIELKAGEADDSVITQVLGYIGALKEEGMDNVRGIVVASGFTRRSRFAAIALQNVKLIRYSFNFVFRDALN